METHPWPNGGGNRTGLEEDFSRGILEDRIASDYFLWSGILFSKRLRWKILSDLHGT